MSYEFQHDIVRKKLKQTNHKKLIRKNLKTGFSISAVFPDVVIFRIESIMYEISFLTNFLGDLGFMGSSF